jgi:hypothetical protein
MTQMNADAKAGTSQRDIRCLAARTECAPDLIQKNCEVRDRRGARSDGASKEDGRLKMENGQGCVDRRDACPTEIFWLRQCLPVARVQPRFRSWIHPQISQMPQIEEIPKADDLAVASPRSCAQERDEGGVATQAPDFQKTICVDLRPSADHRFNVISQP